MILIRACSIVNLTYVHVIPWWVNSGATTHISVFRGYMWSLKPIDAERFIFEGGGETVTIEAIRTFRL